MKIAAADVDVDVGIEPDGGKLVLHEGLPESGRSNETFMHLVRPDQELIVATWFRQCTSGRISWV